MSWIPPFYRTKKWYKLRAKVVQRDNYTCMYCGDKATTADHIIPRGKHGPDTLANLVACCSRCNELAGGREFANFTAKKRFLVRVRKTRPVYGQRKGPKPKPRFKC